VGRNDGTRRGKSSRSKSRPRDGGQNGPRTLVVDIGGTGIKMLVIDAAGKPLTERARELTPHPAEPTAVLGVVEAMLGKMPKFDRVSAGFPGVVAHGIVRTAPNLGTRRWRGFDLAAALEKLAKKPARVLNDADLQGHGVIEGKGTELVLTLGTGLGSALFVDGWLVPNLELGHHPFEKGETYEQRVSNAELQRIGKKRWSARVADAIAALEVTYNYDRLWIGGGNAKKLKLELPENVTLFENVAGLSGGTRLWAEH
jgi:polyphosphate glucokinase